MKKYKITKRYGGGGGNTVETIPEWARPYMENVGRTVESAYASGDLGKVAGASALQQEAFDIGASGIKGATQAGLESLKAQNERLTNLATVPSKEVLEAQKQQIIQDSQERVAGLTTGFGQQGTLGSARQAVMQGAQNAKTVGELAKVEADYENKMFQNRLSAEQAIREGVGAATNVASSGASGLANLGESQRGIDQQGLDSTWQGIQRYASTIYGNPSRQQAIGGK